MKFIINNQKWEIIRISHEELTKQYNEDKENPDRAVFVLGFTSYKDHTIKINKDICYDQQIMTLKHELTHCWIFMHGLYYANLTEEIVCDIVSSVNDFINEVVEKYKKTFKE